MVKEDVMFAAAGKNFVKINAKLSKKVPIFVLSIPRFNLTSLVLPFFLKISLLLVSPPQTFFRFHSLFEIFKIWVPLPLLKEEEHTMLKWSLITIHL